jgi:hypothetical protein
MPCALLFQKESLHIKTGLSIGVHYPNFLRKISLTTFGLALPLVCFIT